ncbi:hypothetical protein C8J57DRAFT_1233297 [Mycena rebaudengoi]|nr:hypothetical protein C8J57DRAFT_1233297 [Mycena rebaudengoi]
MRCHHRLVSLVVRRSVSLVLLRSVWLVDLRSEPLALIVLRRFSRLTVRANSRRAPHAALCLVLTVAVTLGHPRPHLILSSVPPPSLRPLQDPHTALPTQPNRNGTKRGLHFASCAFSAVCPRRLPSRECDGLSLIPLESYTHTPLRHVCSSSRAQDGAQARKRVDLPAAWREEGSVASCGWHLSVRAVDVLRKLIKAVKENEKGLERSAVIFRLSRDSDAAPPTVKPTDRSHLLPPHKDIRTLNILNLGADFIVVYFLFFEFRLVASESRTNTLVFVALEINFDRLDFRLDCHAS